jgi:spore germination protein GerM
VINDDTPSGSNGLPRLFSRRQVWIGAIAGVVLLATGIWFVSARLNRLLGTPGSRGSTPNAAAPGGESRKISATLFYVSSDGTSLTPVTQDVAYGATPAEQVQHIVEAQVQAPPAGQRSAIPAGTTVNAVFVTKEGDAYVDLGGTIVSGQTGGTLDEALTVYAIVNAVTVNVPDVSAVQILVNGHQVETLVGHLDLRYPLPKAPSWVRKG